VLALDWRGVAVVGLVAPAPAAPSRICWRYVAVGHSKHAQQTATAVLFVLPAVWMCALVCLSKRTLLSHTNARHVR
jgi:hypothetical protein